MMIKIGTVFSGIGSVEHALRRMKVKHQIVFACDNGDIEVDEDLIANEISKAHDLSYLRKKQIVDKHYLLSRKTNFVKKTYFANFDISEENYHYNVKFLDGNQYKNKIDLFVGGSPCQSFSMMGYQRGLEDARGTLFYEFARLVKEIEPKVFIYENVQGLLRHDGGKTWKIIHSIFDQLGYHYDFKILNSKDFGVPQNRNRLFVVGFKERKFLNKFDFPDLIPLKYYLQNYLEEYCAEGYFDFYNIPNIPGSVDEKYYPSQLVINHILSGGTKNYYTKPETDLKIARPLLATMHKMHRAGVDNYVTVNGRLRKLTPRECLRLMGFDDDYKIVVSDTQMYKQAGNSIVSEIFIHLLNKIISTNVFEEE